MRYDITDLDGNGLITAGAFGVAWPEQQENRVENISETGQFFQQIIGDPWQTIVIPIRFSDAHKKALEALKGRGEYVYLYYDEAKYLAAIRELAISRMVIIGGPAARQFEGTINLFLDSEVLA